MLAAGTADSSINQAGHLFIRSRQVTLTEFIIDFSLEENHVRPFLALHDVIGEPLWQALQAILADRHALHLDLQLPGSRANMSATDKG